MLRAGQAAGKFRRVKQAASPGEHIQPPAALPFLLACAVAGASPGQPSPYLCNRTLILTDSAGQPFHACSLSLCGSRPFSSLLCLSRCLLAPLCQQTGGMRWGKYGVGHQLEAGLEGRGLWMEVNCLSDIHTSYGHTRFIIEPEEHRGSDLLPVPRVALSNRGCAFSFCHYFFNQLYPLREAAFAPEHGGKVSWGSAWRSPCPHAQGCACPTLAPYALSEELQLPLKQSPPFSSRSSCWRGKKSAACSWPLGEEGRRTEEPHSFLPPSV